MPGVDERVLRKLLSRGVRVEVGEPFPIGGEKRFICLAKVVGRKQEPRRIENLPPFADESEESTQTLCIVSEEGKTAEEARRRLMARLDAAHILPVAPPPMRPRRGWLGRLISVFK